ncbi:MAG: hypothetical protein ACRC92_18640, partial [Peptostreptococcaceae bacterium]
FKDKGDHAEGIKMFKENADGIRMLSSSMVSFVWLSQVYSKVLFDTNTKVYKDVLKTANNTSGKSDKTAEEVRGMVLGQLKFGMTDNGAKILDRYRDKLDNLFEEDDKDDSFMVSDKSKWDKEYKTKVMAKTKGNFSLKKITHLIMVSAEVDKD